MPNNVNSQSPFSYIQTPRQSSSLVKIDAILALRLKAFNKARKIKRFTFSK